MSLFGNKLKSAPFVQEGFDHEGFQCTRICDAADIAKGDYSCRGKAVGAKSKYTCLDSDVENNRNGCGGKAVGDEVDIYNPFGYGTTDPQCMEYEGRDNNTEINKLQQVMADCNQEHPTDYTARSKCILLNTNRQVDVRTLTGKDLEDQIKAFQDAFSEVEKELDDANKKLDDANNKLGTQEELMDEVGRQVQGNTVLIDGASKGITELRTENIELRTQNNRLQTQISQLEGQHAQLEGQYAQLKAQYDALQTGVNT
jgi:hypothetical protein